MRDQTGHRQRVKDRFRKEGLDSFDEVHALELLLFYAISRVDTKPLARALLDRFGSFPLVLQATHEELMSVPGVGESTATFIRLLNATGRYYQTRQNDGPTILDTVDRCKAFLRKQYYGRRDETVFLLCLDAKGRLLSCCLLDEGDVNSANIPTRRLVEIALSANASSVILSHNHPGGLALPSVEDCLATNRISQLMSNLGIVLADHIILSDDDATSLVESGMYRPPRI